MTTRRQFVQGFGASAPAVILTRGVLMPVRTIADSPAVVCPIIRRIMPKVIPSEIHITVPRNVISIAGLRMRYFNRLFEFDPAAAEAWSAKSARETELYRRDASLFGKAFANEIRELSIAKDPLLAAYDRIISQADARLERATQL